MVSFGRRKQIILLSSWADLQVKELRRGKFKLNNRRKLWQYKSLLGNLGKDPPVDKFQTKHDKKMGNLMLEQSSISPQRVDQMTSMCLPLFILARQTPFWTNRIFKNTQCCVQFVPVTLFLSTVRNLLFTKSLSPKLCSICLGDSECVSLEKAAWENAFEFCQHMAEYQG